MAESFKDFRSLMKGPLTLQEVIENWLGQQESIKQAERDKPRHESRNKPRLEQSGSRFADSGT